MMMEMLRQPSYGGPQGYGPQGYGPPQAANPQVHNMQVIDKIMRSDRKTRKKFREMLRNMMDVRGISMPNTDSFHGLTLGPQVGNFPPPSAGPTNYDVSRIPPTMGAVPGTAAAIPGAAVPEPTVSMVDRGADLLHNIGTGIGYGAAATTNYLVETMKDARPGAGTGPDISKKTKYAFTKRAVWPTSLNTQGYTMAGAPWPPSKELVTIPIVEYINKVNHGTIFNKIPTFVTTLQSRIDKDEWQVFHNGFGTPGADRITFLISYTKFLDMLKKKGVSEKDVICALINSYQLDLGTPQKIATFAKMFHKDYGGTDFSSLVVRDWLQNKIMQLDRPHRRTKLLGYIKRKFGKESDDSSL